MNAEYYNKKSRDDTISVLGEAFHTAFRKACDEPESNDIWRLINQLADNKPDAWHGVLEFVAECMTPGIWEFNRIEELKADLALANAIIAEREQRIAALEQVTEAAKKYRQVCLFPEVGRSANDINFAIDMARNALFRSVDQLALTTPAAAPHDGGTGS